MISPDLADASERIASPRSCRTAPVRLRRIALTAAAAAAITTLAASRPAPAQTTGHACDEAAAIVERVSAPKRQARKSALRVHVRLCRSAKVTIRLKRIDGDQVERFLPVRVQGRKGANRIRIHAGEDASLPRGRYEGRVTARVDDTRSEPSTITVRVV